MLNVQNAVLTPSEAARACRPTSKAFTSEETSDDPIVVPPRAPLPSGVPNYVTARGLALLREELAVLESERAALAAAPLDEGALDRRLAVLNARLADLTARIASAQLVDARRQRRDVVRFGATVTVSDENGATLRYTIVGVDEAAPAEGRIAFLAPVARALTGLRVGDVATLRTGSGERTLTVEAIAWDEETEPISRS
jgi:transcription elongation factor GreB